MKIIDSNIVDVNQIKGAVQHAMINTYDNRKCCNDRLSLLDLEHFFQIDHQCEVLKLYSIKNTLPLIKLDNNRSVGINYWHQLQFDSPEDVTMFLLKWS